MLIASMQREKIHYNSTSVLDMTLNHLMVKFQPWSIGECGVLLHYHYSQIHSVKVPCTNQIELFNHLLCLKPFNWVLTIVILKLFNCMPGNEPWLVSKILPTNYSLKYIYKQDLVLGNPQWLICLKSPTNKTNQASSLPKKGNVIL